MLLTIVKELAMRRTLGLVVSALFAGCQGYEANPVKPNALEVQDNTMVVVGHALPRTS